jgi:hypothetical protein
VLVFQELTEHASQEKIRRQEIKAITQEEGQQVLGQEEEQQVGRSFDAKIRRGEDGHPSFGKLDCLKITTRKTGQDLCPRPVYFLGILTIEL